MIKLKCLWKKGIDSIQLQVESGEGPKPERKPVSPDPGSSI